MGLLDEQNIAEYYQGQNAGGYQFTSLEDVITQFEIAYVGEGKILPKAKRSEIAFHAQRALQELSFDTFKSIKSQEIVLPPSLIMPLPHDYVNYTKISFVDSSGIKHPLYKTNKTSNPFSIVQDSDGNYDFSGNNIFLGENLSFESPLNQLLDWTSTSAHGGQQNIPGSTSFNNQGLVASNPNSLPYQDVFGSVNGKLTAEIHREIWQPSSVAISYGRYYSCWQEIDVSSVSELDISGFGVVPANGTGFTDATIRLGISASKGDNKTSPYITWSTPSQNGQTFGTGTNNPGANGKGPNFIPYNNTVAFLQWQDSAGESERKTLNGINVVDYDSVFVLVTMFCPNMTASFPDNGSVDMSLDDIEVVNPGDFDNLQYNTESTTWASYKAQTPSENNNDDYEDNNYAHMSGNRYGLDPQHAQINGSYYIDNVRGKINFSSNISGKTVILDYISDSLGTDGEMQVHKFAEEAMYKCIAYSMLSATTYGQQLVPRFKKEKFAETRKAKLRLSGLKIEELTQILRGKSKQIKH